ncbi:MAG TPA: PBP1A family penicillin-binding protein [Candidatus Cloacimonadota bacterium]|nr:PBP1A family penicillin-binding protein [Candidatus Cloacimonadota bacterium]
MIDKLKNININTEEFKNVLLWVGFGTCVFIGIVAGLFWFYCDSLPPTEELKNFTLPTGSEVYDCNGKLVYLFASQGEKRKLVSIKELPEHLIDALIITEDKRFFWHFGIDPIGLVRAVFADLRSGGYAQGGSTITQQMARNMFLSPEKKLSRKMKELVLAFRIEASFSKEEILEIYFNKIFWGRQNNGVETAALYYFDKNARDLSLAESATLVGMIQMPNYYDPINNPERALKRRNNVLDRMLKAKKISQEEYLAAIETPLQSKNSNTKRFALDYFMEHIRTYLERTYGSPTLLDGGLRIYTTLNPEMSAMADSILNTYLTRFEDSAGNRNKYSSVPPGTHDIDTKYIQGGLVLIENKTGYVRALIGGRNFEHSKFNRMTQAKRQPGSAIKPIFYTLAVEKGYTPSTVINDAPFTLGDWSPQNANRSFHGYSRMRTALTHSYNVWAVKCGYDIGLDAINESFKRFGLNAKANDYTAALGAYEVKPIDLIAAYTAFPNGGWRSTPVFITKVEDKSGKVLERGTGHKVKICTPEVAYIMTSMLESVTQRGTGAGARRGYSWPSAGKTGTSSNNYDSWFIGFNKAYTLGLWTGYDNSKIYAGKAQASNIWGTIMAQAIKIDNKGRFPATDDSRYTFKAPSGVVKRHIHPTSGFTIPMGGIEEYFIEDNIPPMVSDTLSYNQYPTQWGKGGSPKAEN